MQNTLSKFTLKYDQNSNIVQLNKVISDNRTSSFIFEYDYRNSLTSVEVNDGEVDNISQYFYDNKGNAEHVVVGRNEKVTEPQNVTKTDYNYDEYDNVENRNGYVNQDFAYESDPYGNQLVMRDPNGNRVESDYDGLNRVKERRIYNNVNDLEETVKYKYSLNGRLMEIDVNGSVRKYKYDEIGRINEYSDSRNFKKEFIYDSGSNLKNLKVYRNDNKLYEISYDYDKLNRLSNVREGDLSGKIVTSYTYDENGNRKSMSYPKVGVTVNYDYNYANKLTVMENLIGDRVISKFEYTRALDSNITKEIITGNEEINDTKTYIYDKLGRLEKEKSKKLENDYKFDSYHNRSEQNRITDEYIQNLLQAVEYTYDSQNRLKTVKKEGNSVEFKYETNGYRSEKIVNETEKTEFLYDKSEVLLEIKGSEVIKNLRGNGLIAREKDGKKIYYLYDGLGNVKHLIDENGEVIKTYDYDAFGNEINENKNDENPYRYKSQYYDKESGLYYLRVRYYDPTVGRFISEDTYQGKFQDPLSLNLYTYALNNPIKYYDPSGFDGEELYVGKDSIDGWDKVENGWETDPQKDRQTISFIVSMVPIIGDVKDIQELVTGVDLITGEKISGFDRTLTLVGVVLPVVSSKSMRGAGKLADEALELADEALEAVSGFAINSAKQYITTGSVDFKEAAISSVVDVGIGQIGEYEGKVFKNSKIGKALQDNDSALISKGKSSAKNIASKIGTEAKLIAKSFKPNNAIVTFGSGFG